MDQTNNKHGPNSDVGLPMSTRPRDGTERKPRDGTERRPRDGTQRRSRDKTLLRESSLGIRNKNRIAGYPDKAQAHNKQSTERRNPGGGYVGLKDRHGRGIPCCERKLLLYEITNLKN